VAVSIHREWERWSRNPYEGQTTELHLKTPPAATMKAMDEMEAQLRPLLAEGSRDLSQLMVEVREQLRTEHGIDVSAVSEAVPSGAVTEIFHLRGLDKDKDLFEQTVWCVYVPVVRIEFKSRKDGQVLLTRALYTGEEIKSYPAAVESVAAAPRVPATPAEAAEMAEVLLRQAE
jgi:hypothetical protein